MFYDIIFLDHINQFTFWTVGTLVRTHFRVGARVNPQRRACLETFVAVLKKALERTLVRVRLDMCLEIRL